MKDQLEWPDLPDLWNHGIAQKDNGGRWFAVHPVAVEYIDANGYRNPSRNWPHSHSPHRPRILRRH